MTFRSKMIVNASLMLSLKCIPLEILQQCTKVKVKHCIPGFEGPLFVTGKVEIGRYKKKRNMASFILFWETMTPLFLFKWSRQLISSFPYAATYIHWTSIYNSTINKISAAMNPTNVRTGFLAIMQQVDVIDWISTRMIQRHAKVNKAYPLAEYCR